MPTFADEEDKINNMISQDDDDEEEEEEEDDDGEIVMQSANTQTTIQTVGHQPQSTTGNVSQSTFTLLRVIGVIGRRSCHCVTQKHRHKRTVAVLPEVPKSQSFISVKKDERRKSTLCTPSPQLPKLFCCIDLESLVKLYNILLVFCIQVYKCRWLAERDSRR